MEDKKISSKQNRQVFGIMVLKKSHSEIHRLGDCNYHPSNHGYKFWHTSYLLMDYLSKSPPGIHTKVMEVGCGLGLSGICCAKAFNAQVIGVDADPNVFPYLQTHTRINRVKINTLAQRFEHLTTKEPRGFDILIGAEICFWDAQEDSMFELIKQAKDSTVNKIFIADPARLPFVNLAQR